MAIEVSVTRTEIVTDILSQLAARRTNLLIKYDRPYTVALLRAEFDGTEYMGMGVAKICYPDKWDKRRGKRTVVTRAARQIATEYMKELTESATEANEVATDLGLTIMKLAQVSAKGEQLIDFIHELEIAQEIELALDNGGDEEE